jgi:hypothetical protein
MKKVYLSLGAIIRDQEYYIQEWIAFYYLVGVERFTLVLHKCIDRTEELIHSLPFYSDDLIKIHKVADDTQHAQMGAYQWLLDTYGKYSDWYIFVDSDEFYFGTKEDDLKKILPAYEKHSGLVAHWQMFGASDQVIRPPRPTIAHFVRRLIDSCYDNPEIQKQDRYVPRTLFGVKSIVKSADVLDVLSPHLFLTQNGSVLSNHTPVDVTKLWQVRCVPDWSVVRCNHYFTRSMQDWVERRLRGSCNDKREASSYSVEQFFRYQEPSQIDTTIGRFVRFLYTLFPQWKED